MGEMELVEELVEFMGYCCGGKWNQELITIKFYHEQFLGLSLPMNNPLIRPAMEGIKSARA